MKKHKLQKNLIFFLPTIFVIGLVLALNISNIKQEYRESTTANEKYIGDQRLKTSPIGPPQIGFRMVNNNLVKMEIPFGSPVELGGFSVFFYGNLHAVGSYLAEDFDVYYSDENGTEILAEKIINHAKSSYFLKLPQNKQIKSFSIIFKKAKFDNIVQIGDLKFYEKEQVSLWEGITAKIKRLEKKPISYAFHTIVFYFMLLIPGYVLIKAFVKKKQKLSETVITAFSPLISILVLCLTSALFILTKSRLFLYLNIPIFAISLVIFCIKKMYKDLKEAKHILLVTFTVLLIVNAIQLKRDFIYNLDYIEKYLDQLQFIPEMGGYYAYHDDNTLQWGISRMYLHNAPIFSEEADKLRIGYDGKAVLDRTPLFPIMTVPILAMFGESHFVYQRFLNVLMALYYGAAFIAIKEYFKKPFAKTTSYMMLLSTTITYQAMNTEIYFKYIALYPMFLAVYLISKTPKGFKNNSLIGLIIACAYFIHPIILVLIVVLGILYVIRYIKLPKEFLIKALLTFLPALILYISWNKFGIYIKQKNNVDMKRKNIYERQLSTFELESFKNKFYNTINIFIPDIALKREYGPDFSNEYIEYFIRHSLIVTITPILLFYTVKFLIKRKNYKDYWEPILLGTGPLVVFILMLNPYSHGGYTIFYQFILPFLFAIGASQAWENLSKNARYILLSYSLFTLIPSWKYSGVFTSIKYPGYIPTLSGWILALVYIYISYLITNSSLNVKKRM